MCGRPPDDRADVPIKEEEEEIEKAEVEDFEAEQTHQQPKRLGLRSEQAVLVRF
jgi:hypothetical protein